MLEELPGQPESRRWFQDDYFDAIFWCDGLIVRAFQLCYDRKGCERAFSWSLLDGYEHYRVDDGDWRASNKPAAALYPAGDFDKERVRAEFRARGQGLPSHLVHRVMRALDEAPAFGAGTTHGTSETWEARTEAVAGGRRYRILLAGRPIAFRELALRLEQDVAFGRWYTQLLADSDFGAFFWEHPPLVASSMERDAEFVLLDGPSLLALEADPAPFVDAWSRHPDADVAAFPNLGGDALLVVPRPVGAHAAYAHLARFLREGAPEQVAVLWRETGRALRARIGTEPLWLSTAGLGVAWVHVRLDSRPKYYRFDPYKAAP